MFSFTKYPNPDVAVCKLLKNLLVNINPATISVELEKHPDCPSLLAISELCNNEYLNQFKMFFTHTEKQGLRVI